MSTFKQEKLLEERKAETEKIRKKYDDHNLLLLSVRQKLIFQKLKRKNI